MSAATPALPPGFCLYRYATLGSTNDEARRLAQAGAAAGAVVWAAEQTAGRGRRGRAWASPPGNLYLSLLLRPAGSPARAAQLGFVAAVALGEALDRLAGPDLALRFKWPNDVLAGGRKLAGILLESAAGADGQLDFVIIGLGVNLVSAPPSLEFPATSLADQGVAGITPAMLIEGFAGDFAAWAGRWEAQGFAPLRAAWLRRAIGLGEAVRVRLDRLTLDGRFADLDQDGALLLDGADGRRRIAAGDVFPALG
jgi:BirA family transcriptional regulator, biotin operon repressor / biotin---[acetyl-CoA-carboxylase] ligase